MCGSAFTCVNCRTSIEPDFEDYHDNADGTKVCKACLKKRERWEPRKSDSGNQFYR